MMGVNCTSQITCVNSPPLFSPMMPALAAAMASWLGMPCFATADEQNTMEPPPVVIMLFTVGFKMLKQLYRFTFRHCAGVRDERGRRILFYVNEALP